jgi:hypothetical protein
MRPGERLVSRPRIVRREAVVSLDTSCAPAMLLAWGSQNSYSELQLFLYPPVRARYEGRFGSRSKIFSLLLARAGSFIQIGGNLVTDQ